MSKCKTHYDEELVGETLCGLTTHTFAHEDIRQVTCKKCLKKSKTWWQCGICDTWFREKEAHGCFTKNKQWKKIKEK